jgi:hypothetical protein
MLSEQIRVRDAVDALCADIDAGNVVPTEKEILALAIVVNRIGGPFKHDLTVKLASRCRIGRLALKNVAQ